MSEPIDVDSWPRARCYTAEGWKQIPDPLRPGPTKPLPTQKSAAEAGYQVWSYIGKSFKSAPIVLTVCFLEGRRNNPLPEMPGFLVFVEGSFGDAEHVYAEGLPELMDLLGKWLPLAQAAAVVNFASAVDTIAEEEGDLRPDLVRLLSGIGPAER
jgi:hypothetical protein